MIMKNYIGFLFFLLIISCKSDEIKYAKLTGKVLATDIEKLSVQGKNYIKEITVNKDGSFSDTLNVADGVYAISSGNDRITLFLKNGYDLNLEFKGQDLSSGISFSGIGAETNNFMENKRSFFMSDYANPKSYFQLDKIEYEKRLNEAKTLLLKYKNEAKNLDSLINAMDARNDEMFFGYIESNYEKEHTNIVKFAKGNPSPIFENYESILGGKVSLKDLKGKYVYIDVWATWCAPCKVEIPYLKSLEKEYHGKNIQFVSISVDKPEAYETWKKMVKDQELGGVQLYADANFESKFILEYGINSIPRFILLDPNGNIVEADALRPSNPKLKELFTELGI